MNFLDEVRAKKAEILKISQQYGATDVRLFGSVVRGQANETSDLDFLVRFLPGSGLFDWIGLAQDLEQLLGRKVDVVSENGLSPYLAPQILSEAIPI